MQSKQMFGQALWASFACSGLLQVRVFTFAVGPPVDSIESLRDMACNNRGELSLNVAGDNPFH